MMLLYRCEQYFNPDNHMLKCTSCSRWYVFHFPWHCLFAAVFNIHGMNVSCADACCICLMTLTVAAGVYCVLDNVSMYAHAGTIINVWTLMFWMKIPGRLQSSCAHLVFPTQVRASIRLLCYCSDHSNAFITCIVQTLWHPHQSRLILHPKTQKLHIVQLCTISARTQNSSVCVRWLSFTQDVCCYPWCDHSVTR